MTADIADFANNKEAAPEKPDYPSAVANGTPVTSNPEPATGIPALTQWTTVGPNMYAGVSSTIKALHPGVYTMMRDSRGQLVFICVDTKVDDLMDFPDSTHDRILREIDDFWSRSEKFKEFGFLHRRGYLFYGPAGCHAAGTRVIMFDGSLRNVEDVVVGDVLMGPDSTPRRVLELARGIDDMYRVTPTKGDPFIANGNHILHLMPSARNEAFPFPINIKVSDYLKINGESKRRFLLKRSSALNFNNDADLKIPPYILGMWLGDGSQNGPYVTNTDPEVISAWAEFCEFRGLKVRRQGRGGITYCATSGRFGQKSGRNGILNDLRDLGILNNKFVPAVYLTASLEHRLELIAGLLDTDGSYHYGGFDFINKNEQIADSVVFLCRSVGLAAYKSISIKGCWVQNRSHFKTGTYYRVGISGNTNMIPCRILRKKAPVRKQIKDVLRTGCKIEQIERGEYFGFCLSGDHLYLTSDFTIHHNSGKTSIVNQIMSRIVKSGGVVFLCSSPQNMTDGLAIFRQIEPKRRAVCVFEDIDAIINDHGEDRLLSLLDGENQVDCVLNIATTNYPERLDKRMVARPRRFDRVEKIGMPNADVRRVYLSAKLKASGDCDVIRDWVGRTEGLSFAALAELVISVKCLGNTLEDTLNILRSLSDGKASSAEFDTKKVGLHA